MSGSGETAGRYFRAPLLRGPEKKINIEKNWNHRNHLTTVQRSYIKLCLNISSKTVKILWCYLHFTIFTWLHKILSCICVILHRNRSQLLNFLVKTTKLLKTWSVLNQPKPNNCAQTYQEKWTYMTIFWQWFYITSYIVLVPF